MNRWLTILATLGCLMAAPAAFASSLPYPSFLTNGVGYSGEAMPAGLTFVASSDSAFNNGLISGNLHSEVWENGSGQLTFFYQIQPPSGPLGADKIEHLVLNGFGDATILNADYLNTVPGVPWDDIKRTSSSDIVDADYNLGLPIGSSSAVLMLQTDATSYSLSSDSVIDGVPVNVQAFSPAPLPSSLVLFGTGIVGFAGGLFRRVRKGLTARL